MTPQEFTENIKNRMNELLSHSFNSNQSQRSAAHERLFKLIMSLSTLSLTGWVAIIAWNFEPFATQQTIVSSSCMGFIGTLVLLSLSDLAIIIQSMGTDKINVTYRSDWYRISGTLDGMTVAHGANAIPTMDYLNKVETTFANGILGAAKKHPTWGLIIRACFWFSWIYGIGAYILFFWSVCFGVNSMTHYVAKAQELRSKTKVQEIVSKTQSQLIPSVAPDQSLTKPDPNKSLPISK